MTEPILQEVNRLSIWDLSHYWHGFNPQKSTPSRLPLDVQKTIRALTLKASKSLYLRCTVNGFVHRKLIDAEDQIAISWVRRLYKREFDFAIKGKKYKRSFLSDISISRKSVLIWCKKNNFEPPKFWFRDDDPLLSKSVEELDTALSPEQMQQYGYIALFNPTQTEKNQNTSYQFSTDADIESEKLDIKRKNSIIEEAISEINKANAKARYKELDDVKASFIKYYQSNKSLGQHKSELARQFFYSLSFAEKVLVVPTYTEKDKKTGYEKAVRNLLKVIKK